MKDTKSNSTSRYLKSSIKAHTPLLPAHTQNDKSLISKKVRFDKENSILKLNLKTNRTHNQSVQDSYRQYNISINNGSNLQTASIKLRDTSRSREKRVEPNRFIVNSDNTSLPKTLQSKRQTMYRPNLSGMLWNSSSKPKRMVTEKLNHELISQMFMQNSATPTAKYRAPSCLERDLKIQKTFKKMRNSHSRAVSSIVTNWDNEKLVSAKQMWNKNEWDLFIEDLRRQ